MAEKKYYWLKLQRDFFKRHDIRIIESMPNGKDYVLFYLKLLVESIDHNGELRFSDTIPYSETMLSTITNTNIDIVRSAMKVFTELNMIEVLDDATIFMAETQKMVGSETAWAEKKRKYREKRTMSLPSPTDVRQEIDKNKEKDKDKEQYKDIDNICDSTEPQATGRAGTRFKPPTLEEVQAYCDERHNNVNPEAFVDFYASKGWMVGKNKMKDWKAAVRNWERTERKPVNNSKPTKADELDDFYNMTAGWAEGSN